VMRLTDFAYMWGVALVIATMAVAAAWIYIRIIAWVTQWL